MIKTKFIIVFVIVALAVGMTSSQLSFGQEIQVTDNMTLSSDQVIFIIIIGAAAGTVKAWQGYDKSTKDFDALLFVNGIRDSILISIPAALGIALGMPSINAVGYVIVFFGVIGGTVIAQKAKKPSIPSNATPEQINKILGTTSLQIPQTLSTTTIQTTSNSTVAIPQPEEKPLVFSEPVKPLIVVPKLGPEDSEYQTNFIKTDKGNSLPFGNHLWIKVFGVRSYITATLKDASKNIIQIDQSSLVDEDGDITTTRLEMFGRDKKPLPRGKYFVTVRGDFGTSDAQGIKEDEFFII